MYLVFIFVTVPCMLFLLYCLTPKGKQWLRKNDLLSHLTNKQPPLWEGAGGGLSPLDCAPPATADAPQLLPLQGEPEGVT